MQEPASRSSASNGRMSTSRRHRGSSNHPRASQQPPSQPPVAPGTAPGGQGGAGGGRRGRGASPSTSAANTASSATSSNTNAHGGASGYGPLNGADDPAMVMGDGIKNKRMRQDVEDWVKSFGLDPQTPVAVVGFFGRSRDIPTVERLRQVFPPKGHSNDHDGSQEDTAQRGVDGKFSLGAGDSKAVGDIRLYVDQSANTILLHHDFVCNDTDMLARLLPASLEILSPAPPTHSVQPNQQQPQQQQPQQQQPQQQPQQQQLQPDPSLMWMKWMHRQEFASHRALLFLFLISHVVVWTVPDMAVDPKTVSVLMALSQLKRHMMHDLEKFMALCWERLGFQPPPSGYYPPPPQQQHQQQYHSAHHHPQYHHHHHQHHHGQQHPPTGADALLPGTCVPTLLFVVERLQLSDPWYDGSSSEEAIRKGLKVILKSSAERLQSRMQRVFKASHLIPTHDQQGGPLDSRQLFVLPNPPESNFAYVIPYFSVHFNMQAKEETAAVEGAATIQSQWRVLRQEESRHLKPHGTGGYPQKPPSTSASALVDVLGADTPALRGFVSQDKYEIDAKVQHGDSQHTGNQWPMGTTASASLLDLYSALVSETCDPILVPTAAHDVKTADLDDSNMDPSRLYRERQENVAGTRSTIPDSREEFVSTAKAQQPLALAALYHEHASVRLRQFIYDRVKKLQSAAASSAGHGRTGAGKRGATGSTALPPLKQWIAGNFALREGLGIAPPPRAHHIHKQELAQAGQMQALAMEDPEDDEGDEDEDEGASEVSKGGGAATDQGQVLAPVSSTTTSGGGGGANATAAATPAGRPGRSRRGGANRRGGKKLATKTVNLVQKRIHDFVKVDEVMHELYGDHSEQTMVSRGAHSERYHQLKADQAKKLFQSLAHRR